MNSLTHGPTDIESSSDAVKQGTRAIIYARVSTDEQATSGLGIAAQLHACQLWAGREAAVIAGAKIDDGVSSVSPLDHRPALVEALAALEPGGVLVVAKRDRLGRDPIVNAMIEAAVARKRCRVVSAAGEGTASDDPTDVLMRRIVDAFAEYERLLIKARTRAALAAKRRRGERIGQVPFGSDLAGDGKTLVPNPGEGAVMDRMRAWKAAGWSLRAMARELNRLNVKAKGGRPWVHSSVASVLRRLERGEVATRA